MSKITNDDLTWSGTGCFTVSLYPYGNSGRQRVNALSGGQQAIIVELEQGRLIIATGTSGWLMAARRPSRCEDVAHTLFLYARRLDVLR